MTKQTVPAKIFKLIKALSIRDGGKYLYNREQVWSMKLNKPCTIHKLYRCFDTEEYRKMHPDHKPRKNQAYVRELVCDSFKQIDILLFLADCYKGGDG